MYELGIQDQAFLGPESGLAVPDGKGGVDIYVATQWLHVDRDQVAPCLGLEPEQVRIHLAGVGGAFGGREDLSMQIHGALLALQTNRPVKMVYNREESFAGHVHRHPAKIWAEHRADRDGKLVNVHADPPRRRRLRLELDGGLLERGLVRVRPYAVPNALIECRVLYTNNPPCGAMRGFGAVQSCFAAEAQMDKLADALGIDRIELRLGTLSARATRSPRASDRTGSMPVAEVIRRCAALPEPDPEELPRDPFASPAARATPRVATASAGRRLRARLQEHLLLGGLRRLLRRPRPPVRRRGGRARRRGHSAAAEVGQGVTNVIGPGRAHRAPRHRRRRRRAALDRGRRLGRLVLGLAPDVDDRGRRPARVSRSPGRARAARRLARRRRGDRPRARLPPRQTLAARSQDRARSRRRPRSRRLRLLGHASSCEVDVELGLTRVVWIGTAQDVGRALNPQAVYGQIEGGTAQGLGLALMEEIQTKDGLITNASFTDYLIPTALDMPPGRLRARRGSGARRALRRQGRGGAADRRLDRGDRGGPARRDGPRPRPRPGAPGRDRRPRLSRSTHFRHVGDTMGAFFAVSVHRGGGPGWPLNQQGVRLLRGLDRVHVDPDELPLDALRARDAVDDQRIPGRDLARLVQAATGKDVCAIHIIQRPPERPAEQDRVALDERVDERLVRRSVPLLVLGVLTASEEDDDVHA